MSRYSPSGITGSFVNVVFQPIRPAPLPKDFSRLSFLNTLKKFGREVRRDFVATTATWEHKVKFSDAKVSVTGMWVEIYTEDAQYIRVNDGVRTHDILPKDKTKPKPVFRIYGTFKAKTIPGVIGSYTGKQADPIFITGPISAQDWGGIEPREFDKAIHKKWDKKAHAVFQEAMDKAVENSGYGMGD